MVRIIKKSSHPGVRRMKNRAKSLNAEHIQDKICRSVSLRLPANAQISKETSP